jgi:hypothetical protein
VRDDLFRFDGGDNIFSAVESATMHRGILNDNQSRESLERLIKLMERNGICTHKFAKSDL